MVGAPKLRGIPRLLTVAATGAAMAVAPWTSQASHASAGAVYLALGDSISYGYDPTVPGRTTSKDFVGYPTDLGAARGSTVVNASCPGETASSFASAQSKDFGCRQARSWDGVMHVDYQVTQLEFATEFLRSHPSTDLVTIGIGINDWYKCVLRTTDYCSNEREAFVAEYRTNLETILGGLRAVYGGPIVLVGYYAQYYQVADTTLGPSHLNAAMAEVAPRFGAVVADTYGAFAAQTAVFGGDGCQAGLLITGGPTGCDAHLTPAGRTVATQAILKAIE